MYMHKRSATNSDMQFPAVVDENFRFRHTRSLPKKETSKVAYAWAYVGTNMGGITAHCLAIWYVQFSP